MPRIDVYTRVTERIIADLEKGVRPWRKPWSVANAEGSITRPLRHNGLPYRGVNVLLLWGEAVARGYTLAIWMTFKQAGELGGHIRKGEHGGLVVYADKYTKTETDENGDEIEKQIAFMKGYTVFNVEQIEGLPAHYYARVEPKHTTALERLEFAERFFAATGAVIRHGGARAFYRITDDVVQMPEMQTFRDAESYYSTAAHEITHWTRYPSRLNRDFGRKRYGDEGYAMEELVAEIGAAFLCADLEITAEPREDHAAYVASWLKALKDDKKFVFIAASHAQKAADFLHSLQPKPEPEPNPPGQVRERDPARAAEVNEL